MTEICINDRYVSTSLPCTNCFSDDEAVIVSELCVRDEDLGLEFSINFALCPGCLSEMSDEIFDNDNECSADTTENFGESADNIDEDLYYENHCPGCNCGK